MNVDDNAKRQIFSGCCSHTTQH